MAHLTKDKTAITARIVFWGIPSAGVSTNLRVIHDKLRSDHRGDLRTVPTALDPTTHYEMLPIELGQLNGLRTQLQVVGLPSGPEGVATRKQLLDRVDGIVLIVDAQPALLDENLRSVAELRESLAAYGRSLDELPVVVQYNKRDLTDPYTIEDLHRRLSIPAAAVFEAVATEATGVLQTLTTISKRVIRVLSDVGVDTAAAEPSVSTQPTEPADEEARIDEAQVPDLETPDETEVPITDQQSSASMTSSELMEQAILDDGDEEDPATDSTAGAAEYLLDPAIERPWEAVTDELKQVEGARIGADFEVVSVGTATRAGERAVRVPLVLGNPSGETVTLALTIQLDPVLDGIESSESSHTVPGASPPSGNEE